MVRSLYEGPWLGGDTFGSFDNQTVSPIRKSGRSYCNRAVCPDPMGRMFLLHLVYSGVTLASVPPSRIMELSICLE